VAYSSLDFSDAHLEVIILARLEACVKSNRKIKMTAAEQLTSWVAAQHSGQLIKKTNTPYFSHLITVASIAKSATRLGYEIGLCHDLLEDTDITEDKLLQALLHFGYPQADANEIVSCVTALTDVYTKKAYPNLSKTKRKKLESDRLLSISPPAQTVKYADLMDNVGWMLIHDQKHAKRYLKKKRLLIASLDQGDHNLRQQALGLIDKSL
jgi:(p)ppGpp synthase/HD superfamily hydrolase